jgi:hypothetical protein
MIKQHGVYSEPNRRKNMSYKEYLNKRIKDLEQTMSKTSEEKEKIQVELNKLKLAEFEEDMATESNQQLLKG